MTSIENIPKSIFDVTATDLDGNEVKLDKFKGKCLLVVNIASDCKLLTQNLAQLRATKEKFTEGSREFISHMKNFFDRIFRFQT